MYDFNRDSTMLLIGMYRSESILHDMTSPLYKNKVKKQEKLEEIANKLSDLLNCEITVVDVKKKISNLRTQYFHEVGKVNKSKYSGMETNEVYKPSWWCYSHLQFLNNSGKRRSGESNLTMLRDPLLIENVNRVCDRSIEEFNISIPEIESDNSSGCTYNSTSFTKLKCNKRKKENDSANLIERTADALYRSMDMKKDDLDQFGTLVASELRKLKKIHNVHKVKKNILSSIYDMIESEMVDIKV